MNVSQSAMARQPTAAQRAMWVGLVAVGGAGFSLIFACVTPFAALGTLAALKMERRDAALAIGLVWFINQAVGYGILGYPWTWSSLGWGFAIGAAGYLALGAAMALSAARPVTLAISLPFVGAFAVYELGLYAAGSVLPGGASAFSASIMERVFVVNLGALVGLLAVYQLASLVGSLSRPAMQRGIATSAH
jgi:hypothetical protein